MNRNKRWAVVVGVLLLAALIVVFVVRRGSSDNSKQRNGDVANQGKTRSQARTSPRAERVDPRTAALGSISGTVNNTKGQPVADARVCTQPWSKDLSSEDTRQPICTRTKSDGTYKLDKLMAANHRVSASAPEHIPAYWKNAKKRTRIRLAAGEHLSGLDIVMRGGAVEVHGMVSDVGGGGVAGAIVTVRSDDNWRDAAYITRTNDKGEFKAWAAPGDIDVTAYAEGYARGSKEVTWPGQAIEVLLTPESVLAGRVIDAVTKEPVANASVSVNGGDFSWRRGTSYGTAFTDNEGRFRLTRLRPGRYKPTASALGRFGHAAESVLLGLGQTRDDVVIEVHPAFVVTAKVVIGGDESKPCERGWVRLRRQDQGRGGSASTESDGSVTFRALMPGTYKVRVRCSDHLPKDEYPELVIVDKDIDGLVWSVDVGASIRGKVVTKAGKPVPDVSIRARSTGGAPRAQRRWGWGSSEEDGTFELKGLLSGQYRVSAHSDKFPEPKDPIEVDLSKGDPGPIEFVLDPGGKIQGRVVDEDGKPVSGVRVRAVGKTERWGWGGNGRSIDDGTFEIVGLREGEYRVVARRGWWGGALRKPGATDDDVHGEIAKVRSGEVARVELTVESQSGVIRGQVVDESGKPVSDAFVTADRESESATASRGSARRSSRWNWWRKPELTDTEGRFHIEKLSKGKYTVRAYRRGGGEAFVEGVALGSDVTVTIQSTGSIAGTVKLSDGKPPAEFSIAVRDKKSGFSRTEYFFHTKGVWAMRDLPAGNFQVSVDAPEGTSDKEMALSQGQKLEGVAFVLESKGEVTGVVVSMEDGKPIANMSVRAQAVKAGGGYYVGGRQDKKNITDAQGRFELENTPAGRIYVTVWPMDWEKSEYAFSRVVRTIEAGKRTDVGTIEIPKRRLGSRERPGDLGFKLKEAPPDQDPSEVKLIVGFIRPGGPAENSGLEVGDEITKVDGKTVTGEKSYLYYALSRVPAGTKVGLGVARGKTITITTSKPL